MAFFEIISSDDLITVLSEKQKSLEKAAVDLYSPEVCSNDNILALYDLLLQVSLFGESGLSTDGKYYALDLKTLDDKMNGY